jgi:hypothetical protein
MKSRYFELVTRDMDGVINKLLVFKNISTELNELFFMPKLKNIGFKNISNELIVELKDENYRDVFNNWLDILADKLVPISEQKNVISLFNVELKKLIQLTSKEKQIPLEKIRGLYGELLELKRLIKNSSVSIFEVLSGWNRPHPANHDFDYSNYSMEVKAIGRSSTRVKISSESQLEQNSDKKLFVKVSVVDSISKSKEDSIGALYNEILELLETPLHILFENKCADDKYFQYLGPKYMHLNYKLYEMQSNFFKVDFDTFPRIKKEINSKGISHVKYEIDLSSMEPFKISEEPWPVN